MDSEGMRTLRQALLYLWQLPQNLLGLLFLLFMRPSRAIEDDGDAVVRVSYRMRGGISLGRYVFINTYECRTVTVRHELGHCAQSRLLGPLYLLVIGLPSLLWAWLGKGGDDYYRFFTESWADRLGGVER